MYFRAYGWGLSRLLITNNILTRKWDSFESKLEVLLIKYKFELDQKFLLRMTTTKNHEIKPNCVKLAKDQKSFFSFHNLTAVRLQFPKSITVKNMQRFSKKCLDLVKHALIQKKSSCPVNEHFFNVDISSLLHIAIFCLRWLELLANMDKILPRSLAFTPSTSDILTDKKSSAKSEHTLHNSIFM